MTATQNLLIEAIEIPRHAEDFGVAWTRDREGYAIFDFTCPACGDLMEVHYLDAHDTVTCDCGHGALAFD